MNAAGVAPRHEVVVDGLVFSFRHRETALLFQELLAGEAGAGRLDLRVTRISVNPDDRFGGYGYPK